LQSAEPAVNGHLNGKYLKDQSSNEEDEDDDIPLSS